MISYQNCTTPEDWQLLNERWDMSRYNPYSWEQVLAYKFQQEPPIEITFGEGEYQNVIDFTKYLNPAEQGWQRD